jgi:transcriptional regulator with PAS, ATPase and Fis domain
MYLLPNAPQQHYLAKPPNNMQTAEIQSIKARFGIIGNSPLLNHAIEIATQVAPTDLSVLISGESGSGKESFSKIIHTLSPRKHGQFIAINCGAIPEGTIDSELFGHEKGSFTGALEARKGYFEVTDGGTIFLDEVAEMPIGTQARLLRVLESGEFIRVGSSKIQKTNVRVIAATNVNMIEAVAYKKFREDLFYRLNSVPLFVPPLRERGTDIELIFRKFTTDFAEKHRIKPVQLSPDAKELLISYPFPGNIRQLKNISEQISILESNKTEPISETTLKKYLPPIYNNTALSFQGGKSNQNEPTFDEREILYKVLFDMKKDMTDLKKLVLQLIQNGGEVDSSVLQGNPGLFKNLEIDDIQPDVQKYESEFRLLPAENPNNSQNTNNENVVDIIHETEDVSFSLEKQEKDMIIKALRKNRNKRKHAAADLGISERTLYRKIIQYDIEE